MQGCKFGCSQMDADVNGWMHNEEHGFGCIQVRAPDCRAPAVLGEMATLDLQSSSRYSNPLLMFSERDRVFKDIFKIF